MKAQRLVVVLTLLNVALFVLSLRPASVGAAPEVAPVLRGRALEIVDGQGRVRASISVLPADPKVKMPDGTTGYPETVLLRLITAQGRPNVKISSTDRGSARYLGGEDDPAFVQILSEGPSPTLKLSDKDGRVLVVKPQRP